MVEVLIITYSMLMWVVFKVFKVPLNKWTGTGGVVSIGFLLLMMGMYHPFTKEARIYTLTTPVLPTVKGRVIEVNVEIGDRVTAGDVLFRIDPEPFQYEVDRLDAELILARSNLVDATRAQATVDSLTAQLANAHFNLSETDVRAEGDGYVAQVRLRPGALAVPMPFNPNPLQNIQPGFKAEVIFIALPGKVFAATVEGMSDIMAQGQLMPDGKLLSINGVTPPGRVLVGINIEDDLSAYQLPVGAKAYVAVYSDSWKPVAIIRQVILRVMSWENYLFSFMA